MADRNFTSTQFAMEKNMVHLFALVSFAAPTAPVLNATQQKGILSVTRNSTGVLTFVFGSTIGGGSITDGYTLMQQPKLDCYNRLLFANCTLADNGDGYSSGTGLRMYVSNSSNVNSPTACSVQVTFVNDSGTPTDPDDSAHATTGYFMFVLSNSTAQ